MINKAFRYRIYPSEDQKKTLTSQFGQVRFVHNYFLRKRIDYYATNKGKKKQSLNYYDTAKMLTELKHQPEFLWLNESNSQSLQQSLRDLDAAYSHFFNDGAEFPKFKKKRGAQLFRVPQSFTVDIEHGYLQIPKTKPIKTIFHRKPEGFISSITISIHPSGKYFASVLCEIQKTIKPKRKGPKIGIDLGLKSFLVTSNGERVETPKLLRKTEEKLKRVQRLLSHKKKGSKNSGKVRIKVARIHEKITNQRNDFLHKLSHRLISENQAIFTEDLNVKGILKNHHLAKSISDCGWSKFVRQLYYKSEWNGVHFEKINRFFPSSKRCNTCGWINEFLTLADREWACMGCGSIIDRDLNAAQNILLFGIKQIPWEPRESKLGERRCMKAPHRTRKPHPLGHG
jgi:putative transposase